MFITVATLSLILVSLVNLVLVRLNLELQRGLFLNWFLLSLCEEQRASDLWWVLRCGHLFLLLPDEPLQLRQRPTAMVLPLVTVISFPLVDFLMMLHHQILLQLLRCHQLGGITDDGFTVNTVFHDFRLTLFLLGDILALMVKVTVCDQSENIPIYKVVVKLLRRGLTTALIQLIVIR